jgi:hypothetical protein
MRAERIPVDRALGELKRQITHLLPSDTPDWSAHLLLEDVARWAADVYLQVGRDGEMA